MKKNEKILAAGLGLAIVGYFGWPMARSVLIEPIEQLEVERDVLRSDLTKKEDENVQLQISGKKLADWRKQGLPGNELDAQRLYQQWLTELAVASNINAKITPDRRSRVNGVYTAVQVTLDGQAKFKDLQSFLRRFYAVDLLQRITRLDIESPAAEGDPPLKFVLSAEGMNLDGAPKRTYVFPQHELKAVLPAGATELTIPSKEFRAKAGDLIRFGKEFAAVAKVEGDRIVLTRGADGTAPAEHPVGTIAELFPLMKPDPKAGVAKNALAAPKIDNPFLKPRKYDPKIDGLADQKLVRGTPLKASIKVADYDDSAGRAKIELVSGPEGLKFDPATGDLAWNPADDTPNGEYKVSFAANVPVPQKRVEKTVTITLGAPNAPPKFEEASVSDFFLGEKVDLPLKAADPENAGPVAYKLDSGPPGATVDATTGKFRWDIPKNFNPGEVTVTVSATDKGDPPQTAQHTLKVKVLENLKPFVYLVGSLADEAGRYAWLYDRSSNRNLVMREGKSFEAAGLSGVVREIGRDFVTYERNGHVWRLALGRNLDEVEKLADEPVAETTPVTSERPVEAERPASGPEARVPSATAGNPATAS